MEPTEEQVQQEQATYSMENIRVEDMFFPDEDPYDQSLGIWRPQERPQEPNRGK